MTTDSGTTPPSANTSSHKSSRAHVVALVITAIAASVLAVLLAITSISLTRTSGDLAHMRVSRDTAVAHSRQLQGQVNELNQQLATAQSELNSDHKANTDRNTAALAQDSAVTQHVETLTHPTPDFNQNAERASFAQAVYSSGMVTVHTRAADGTPLPAWVYGDTDDLQVIHGIYDGVDAVYVIRIRK